MNLAVEALERQLQTIRSLKAGIAKVNQSAIEWSRMPATAKDEAYQWANDVALLGAAQPMFWAQETLDAVFAMAPSFNLHEITCSRELLYCDLAFCWFQEPRLSVNLRSGGPVPVQALTWAFALPSGTRTPVISVTAYTMKNGAPSPVTWASVLSETMMDSFDLPDMNVLTVAEQQLWRRQCGDLFRFVVCAGAFLRQKIAVVEEHRPDRHARKRIAAEGWPHEPIVSVILLREREPRTGGEQAGQREYQWQWMVRAHTRQQYYPSLQKHLPVLIGPYIKGPEDKPLKPRTTPVFLIGR